VRIPGQLLGSSVGPADGTLDAGAGIAENIEVETVIGEGSRRSGTPAVLSDFDHDVLDNETTGLDNERRASEYVAIPPIEVPKIGRTGVLDRAKGTGAEVADSDLDADGSAIITVCSCGVPDQPVLVSTWHPVKAAGYFGYMRVPPRMHRLESAGGSTCPIGVSARSDALAGPHTNSA
jgi:hypothetical protein